METPFKNDIFSMIWKAFKNLYPDKDCLCFWDPMIRDSEDGAPVYGLTDFGDDGQITVFVKSSLTIENAAEIFAHELAHVAVGVGHDHDDVWEKAFDDIFCEYNRIGEECIREDVCDAKMGSSDPYYYCDSCIHGKSDTDDFTCNECEVSNDGKPTMYIAKEETT